MHITNDFHTTRDSLSQAKPLLAASLFLVAVLFGLAGAVPFGAAYSPVFIDSELLAQTVGDLSVIVTAKNAETAAQAVQRVGGEVTSTLWLIDAVAANVPATQLTILSRLPSVQSVVPNSSVQSTSCNGDASSNSCTGYRPGWVTDRRKIVGEAELPANQLAPFVHLPGGGLAAVAVQGTVTYFNDSGTIERQVSELEIMNVDSKPLVGMDGSLILSGLYPPDPTITVVYALNPDGSIRWRYGKREALTALTMSGDGREIYVMGMRLQIDVLDAATGEVLKTLTPTGDKPGIVTLPPVIGPDGTLFIQSSGQDPNAPDSQMNVLAVDPTRPDAQVSAYRWRFTGEPGSEQSSSGYSPVYVNGRLALSGGNARSIVILNAQNGKLEGVYPLTEGVSAQPVTGDQGILFVPSESHLFALNLDGAVHFDFRSRTGAFNLPPLVSRDGATVYAAAGDHLYAVDVASGVARWEVTLPGSIQDNPVLDVFGNVVLGGGKNSFLLVSPGGQILSHLRLADSFVQAASLNQQDHKLLVQAGQTGYIIIDEMPEIWTGQLDVEPSDFKQVWQLSNPIAVGIGADGLHEAALTGGSEIQGQDVTVAVVDSGVYFDSQIKQLLNATLKKQFLGQADFTDGGKCSTRGIQNDTYCFAFWADSADPYGHGSHVAGIIWSDISDYATGATMGIAPKANILSVRVLNEHGIGSYEDVIKGIQYVVENKDSLNIRVLNLSLSAAATTPYFLDPLNRAAEAAWANGIVVVAAAGNTGPRAETITVPGNDPYVITVGAVDNNRTPGYWADDVVPTWSASGPTQDGFAKPDVLAPGQNIISFMHNDAKRPEESAQLAMQHPDRSAGVSLFRMHGTSMATAVTSGVVALMLQVHPELSPDQVKFRLMDTARPFLSSTGDPVYNSLFRQGAGRIWAPDAVLATDLPPNGVANIGMAIVGDLIHNAELNTEDKGYHFSGPIRRVESDDGRAYLYYLAGETGETLVEAAAWAKSMEWIDASLLAESGLTRDGSPITVQDAGLLAGKYAWAGANSLADSETLPNEPTVVGGEGWSSGRTWAGTYVMPTHWVNDDGSIVVSRTPGIIAHIADLDIVTATQGAKGSATVAIAVHESYGQPVSGATVRGRWSSGEIAECLTSSSGECVVLGDDFAESIVGNEFTFTVLSIACEGCIYDSGQNRDPDGDSDGTTIAVTTDLPVDNSAPADNAPPVNNTEPVGDTAPTDGVSPTWLVRLFLPALFR